MISEIESLIFNCVRDAKASGVVVGVSGGIDSAVALVIARRALGKRRVFAILMPDKDRINWKAENDDALELCKKIDVKFNVIPITDIKNTFIRSVGNYNNMALGNLVARIRTNILYGFANNENLLVLGTSDKSEYMIGYFTKFGDGACDLAPIIHLYKTQIRKLAKELGIPEKIINKKSTPNLWDNHVAEDDIGVDYDIVDKILSFVESYEYPIRPYNTTAIGKTLQLKPVIVKKIVNLYNNSQHKRIQPLRLNFQS